MHTPTPTSPQPRWGEPGYHVPRRKLTTRAKTIVALAIVGAVIAFTAMVMDSNSGAESSDAAKDAQIHTVSQPDAAGVRYGHLNITNQSSKTSDYYVELRLVSSGGNNIGMANATAKNVEPGQWAKAEFSFTEIGVDRVEVAKVHRTDA
jgi:hypothetical protein